MTDSLPAPPTHPPARPPTTRVRRRSVFDEARPRRRRPVPWFVASVAAHLVAFGALALYGPKPLVRPVATLPSILVATIPDDDETLATPPPEPDPFPAPETSPLPDPSRDLASDGEPPAPPDGDVDLPPADPTPGVAELPAPEPLLVPPGVIGLRRGPPRTTEPPEPPDGPTPAPVPEPIALPALPRGDPTLDDEVTAETNRKAAARMRELLRDGTGALGGLRRGVRSEDLLVVSNGRAFDHLENVLEEIAIPYARVSIADLATRVDLSRTRLVLWNCGPPIGSTAWRDAIARKIAAFVAAGGYLWTTDWGIRDVVMTAFPGRLATSTDRLHTLPELVLDVRPAGDAAQDPLLLGVLPASGPCRWWLEAAAAEVRVVDRTAVKVLLEAPQLAGDDPRRSTVIAATFAVGRGRVLHVMGHAWQEKTDLEGTAAMQRLALNFVRARIERDAATVDSPR